MTATAVPEVIVPPRTEREVAADTVWALVKAEVIPLGTPMAELCRVTGLTLDDLRLASIRGERVRPERLLPRDEVTRPAAPVPAAPENAGPRGRRSLPPAVYVREPMPARGDLSPESTVRLHPRARRVVADRVFAELRAYGNLSCSRCGKPLTSGCEVEIESAHHYGGCP